MDAKVKIRQKIKFFFLNRGGKLVFGDNGRTKVWREDANSPSRIRILARFRSRLAWTNGGHAMSKNPCLIKFMKKIGMIAKFLAKKFTNHI